MIDAGDSRGLEARLEAMLASSLDAVITIDASGRVLTFNAAAERIFGYSEAEACGRDVAELIIPPSLRARHRDALARHLATGEQTIMNRRVELTGMNADGSVFPVELTVTRVPIDGPPTFTGYLRDITERKRAELELLASRARVVEAADRERRKIERNLHDGAQQRLLSIGILLRRLAAMEAAIDPSARDLVDLAQEETGRAIEELREIARGIHPASLVEGGLATALQGLALRVPLDVTVQVRDARLPDAVEIAFFYVASEALANVTKHARTSQARVTLELADGIATLQVTDTGAGGAAPSDGSGLAGLVDRLEAIGGTLTVDSPEGAGTTVTAVAPAS